MSRKTWVALAAAAALVAAGCGGNDSSSSDEGAKSKTSALPKLNGAKIEVTAEWQKDEQKNFQQVLADFEKRTGAKVQYTSTGSDTATILGTRVAGGNPPDVSLIPQPGLIQQFVTKGALKPLPQDVQDLIKANYSKDWQDRSTYNGKPYAVWFKGANKSVIWYRPDSFDQAGVQPAKNWGDFVKDLGTLRDAGVTPLSVGGGDGWTLTDWFENVYLTSAGADMYDKLTKHEIPWTDASVKKALTMLGQAWNKQLIAANSQQATMPDSVTTVFGTKKAAQVFEGDFVEGVIKGSTQAQVGTDAKTFAFPKAGDQPESVVSGGDAAVIFKDSPAARALVTYLASPESADVWVRLGGFISPNKAVDRSHYPDDVAKSLADQLVTADVVRFDMSDQTPSQFGGTPGRGEWKALQDFLANPTTVNQTAAKLESDAAKAYGS